MADIVPILDASDPRVAAYLSIQERDLVGRRDHFIAEGEVVLRALVAARRQAVVSLFVAEPRLPALHSILPQLPADTPIFVAPQPVLDAIAGFHLHRGILALGRRPPGVGIRQMLAGIAGDPAATAVVAVGIANHDNMGGIIRNAAAFGATAVALDRTSCDPFYRKAIRVAAGTTFHLPIARAKDDEDLIATLADLGFALLAFTPTATAALHEFRRDGALALLFGAEGTGLPASIIARAATVRIPMAPGVDSLNVATASGIALHHVRHAAAIR